MKKLVIIALALVPATVFAAGLLVGDDNGRVIQGFTPTPQKSQNITSTASINISQSGNLAWEATNTGVDCSFRIMEDTTKSKWAKQTIYGGETRTYPNAKTTTFVNFTGCTALEYRAQ